MIRNIITPDQTLNLMHQYIIMSDIILLTVKENAALMANMASILTSIPS